MDAVDRQLAAAPALVPDVRARAGQPAQVVEDLPAGAAVYLCGPLPFMQAVRSALIGRGVAPRDIQYEVFGPDLWQADFVTEDAPGAETADVPA